MQTAACVGQKTFRPVKQRMLCSWLMIREHSGTGILSLRGLRPVCRIRGMAMVKGNPTVEEWKMTLDLLRETYPFTDNATININAKDMASQRGLLEVTERNSETGVLVTLSRDYVDKDVIGGINGGNNA